MAQWGRMTSIMQQCLTDEALHKLYPPDSFPIELRHYMADWIESQRWDEYSLEKIELTSKAQTLLNQTITMLQMVAQQTVNVVDKMKLMQISRNMGMFQQQPLQFAVIVRDLLKEEKAIIEMYHVPARETVTLGVDHLLQKVYSVQDIRKKGHQLEEELNLERQNYESLQGPFQQVETEATKQEKLQIQNKIQNLDYNMKMLASERLKLLQECVDSLEHCQKEFLSQLKSWRVMQHRAVIGFPFNDNPNPLQTWCEQLLGVNGSLRQELLIGEPIKGLLEKLGDLLKVLIESSLVVEKQPPQVIKTQSKFSTTVRYLLGEKVAPGKPVMLRSQIVNELQARNAGCMPSDNVGELINASAILEHNTTTKSTCATFRNMSIKKIKRADRKGSESVTEEKFAFVFSADVTITGCDRPYRVQTISHPSVVIVHGSQDNNAMATIIWDCAFSEPDRLPFVVPERVTWRSMCETLNRKFVSEVQTTNDLDPFNLHFLAQKIFDNPLRKEDFGNQFVSWGQFNKEVLPGRTFTFWQWFEGAMELTKKHLSKYWTKHLIFGFIGKHHLHMILSNRGSGTFLLRFSDSEIGGITIAYVSIDDNGTKRVQNIQPFTKKDLEIRSLGDRIRDINEIMYLYPNCPKDDCFKDFYSDFQPPNTTGYIPVTLQTKVAPNATAPTTTMAPMPDNDHAVFTHPQLQPQFNAGAVSNSMMETAGHSPSFHNLHNAQSPNPTPGHVGDSLPGFSINQFQPLCNNHGIPSNMNFTDLHTIDNEDDNSIAMDFILDSLQSQPSPGYGAQEIQ